MPVRATPPSGRRDVPMRPAVELAAIETKSAVVVKIRSSNLFLRIRLRKSGNDRAGPIGRYVHAASAGSRVHAPINETPSALAFEEPNTRGVFPANRAGWPKIMLRLRCAHDRPSRRGTWAHHGMEYAVESRFAPVKRIRNINPNCVAPQKASATTPSSTPTATPSISSRPDRSTRTVWSKKWTGLLRRDGLRLIHRDSEVQLLLDAINGGADIAICIQSFSSKIYRDQAHE